MAITVEHEPTPLEQALEAHLRKHFDKNPAIVDWIPTLVQAVNLAQMAAKEDSPELLDQELDCPWNGYTFSVEMAVKAFHLNTFINWGGDLND